MGALLEEGREEASARKHWLSKTHPTQSAIWSKLECPTVDSLPGFSEGDPRSGTLDSLPELSDDSSSVAGSVSESASSSRECAVSEASNSDRKSANSDSTNVKRPSQSVGA